MSEWSVEPFGHNWVVKHGELVMGSYITRERAEERLPELQEKYGSDDPPPKQKRGGPYYYRLYGAVYGPVPADTKEEVRQMILRKLERKRLPRGTEIWPA